MTYLYVIGPADGPYKVGLSASPEGRLAALQTGHSERLKIHATKPAAGFPDEARAHRVLSAYRTNGEWFACDLDTILDGLNLPRTPSSVGNRFSADCFRAWLAEMRRLPPYHSAEYCRATLGLSHEEFAEAKAYGGPHMLALACRALLHRLEPYG